MGGMQIFQISNLLSVYFDLINYVGYKPILDLLLFFNRLFKKGQKCLMCTRMISHIKKHSCILKQLDSVLIDELLANAPDNLKNVFELMRYEKTKSVLSLSFFIEDAKLNNSCISDKQQIFMISINLELITRL